MDGRRRVAPALFSVAMVTAVAWPATWNPPRDSFPLSSYPMFARDVSEAKQALLVRAVGIDAKGRALVMPPDIVANGEVMQAFATLRQAVERGPVATQALCEQLAKRITAQQAPPWQAISSIEIGTYRYDPIDYFVHQALPQRMAVHGSCHVRHLEK